MPTAQMAQIQTLGREVSSLEIRRSNAAADAIACRFCDGPIQRELVAESQHGYALASFGLMVEGWLLSVPPAHVSSIAELTESEWAPFKRFTGDIFDRVGKQYAVRPVMFEHGSAGAGRLAGCGVDHAHLHIVPLELDIRLLVGKLEGGNSQPWQATPGRPEARPGLDYLWVVDGTGSWVRYSEDQGSQVIRRAIASELGVRVWDWKQDSRQDLVDATVATLKSRSTRLAS